MKIVVLDGYTLNPGDLTWDALKQIAPVEIYDRTPLDSILKRAEDADVLLTNKTPLTAETISKLLALRYVGVLATGYNVVDVDAAKAKGIIVTNIPTYGTRSVVQHVFSLILELCVGAGYHSQTVREGRWSKNIDWCYWDKPLIELDGLTLGLIGYGRIGKAVAAIGAAMGMKIIVHDLFDTPGAEKVSLNDLLQRSDIISLHCPLTNDTKGLINSERIKLMKPTAMLINTARGPLIVDADLAQALNEGRIANAGLDVLTVEPPPADNPLLKAKNCIITPHIAWATKSARMRLLNIAVENVKAYQNSKPQNIVNA
ncbi:MAG: D-2-hydroxyacid dehydrogenase [Bacteroidales bacterium]